MTSRRSGLTTAGTRRVRWAALLLATPLAAAAVAGGAVSAAAPAEVSFTTSSSAAATEVTANSTSIPLSPETTVGGPTAQTLLDSNGASRAYAASPDPSSNGATLPPLACSLSGLPVPPQACSYPLFASSDLGDAPQSAGSPGNAVTAKSEETSAAAAADVGQAPAGMHVTSLSKLAPDGTVTSTAEATVDEIGVNTAVTIKGFRVLAEASKAVDGKLKTRQEISAGLVQVAGQSFGLTNGAFSLPGANQVPVPADVVFSLLKGAGVTASFQQGTKTSTGVVAPSLSLVYTVPATSSTRPVQVVLVLGRASAQVLATAIPTEQVPGGGPPSGSSGPGAGGAVVDPLTSPPSSSLDGGGTSPVVPETQTPSTEVPAVVAPAEPGRPALTGFRQPGRYELDNIYLAVVAAGLFTFATATSIRLLGVRFT